MTQLTIAQWLSDNIQPRYRVVASLRFYNCYDVLDTVTGVREPCANLATARATANVNNYKNNK